MVYDDGQTADTLHTDLPYSHQLERAARYYHRKGNTSEQARILLYLGRAYVEEMETGKALHIYLKALDKSLSVNNNNLSGYINSYIGDLYDNQASYNIALKKYLSAATYFEKAKNIRSQAFAYRDASRMCYLTDSLEAALEAVLISFDKFVKHDLYECNLYHSFRSFSKEFIIDGQPSEVFQP